MHFIYLCRMQNQNKVFLMILDGWGIGKHDFTDGIYNAKTPFVDSLFDTVPNTTLTTFGNAVGLPELITSTQEEYEALAIDLALSPNKLADIKLKLAKNRLTAPLFDTPLFTKNLESAYIKMYERYHANLESAHILIESQLG